jgi:hypothetical protein
MRVSFLEMVLLLLVQSLATDSRIQLRALRYLPSQLVSIVKPLAAGASDPILHSFGIPDLFHKSSAIPRIRCDIHLTIYQPDNPVIRRYISGITYSILLNISTREIRHREEVELDLNRLSGGIEAWTFGEDSAAAGL